MPVGSPSPALISGEPCPPKGLAADEYPPQEQVDLADVIGWLAAQCWCTGRVGMYGTSYSGFNSSSWRLRPPALSAVVAIYASVPR
jgi:predicted acyl esterase